MEKGLQVKFRLSSLETLFVFLLVSTQIAPQFFGFFSDTFLFVCSFAVFLSIINLWALIGIIFVLLFSLKASFVGDGEYVNHLLAMARPFCIFLIITFLNAKKFKVGDKSLTLFLIFTSIIFIFPNLLSDTAIYCELNNFWNGEYRFVRGQTVACHAASVRLSSIFPQPASAGLALFGQTVLLSGLAVKFWKSGKILPAIILMLLAAATIYAADLAKSSGFDLLIVISIPMIIFFILFQFVPLQLTTIFIVTSACFLYFVLIVVGFSGYLEGSVIDDLMSGRVSMRGNHLQAVKEIDDVKSLFFGSDSSDILKHRNALGDSGYLMKLFIGGLALVFGIYALTIQSAFAAFSGVLDDNTDLVNKVIWLLLWLSFALYEMGVNGFSQPGIHSYLFVCAFLVFQVSTSENQDDAQVR